MSVPYFLNPDGLVFWQLLGVITLIAISFLFPLIWKKMGEKQEQK